MLAIGWQTEGLAVQPLFLNTRNADNIDAIHQGFTIPILQDDEFEKVAERHDLIKDDLVLLDEEGREYKRLHTVQPGPSLLEVQTRAALDGWVREILQQD
ncbi:MAG: hypothetical protein ACE15D_15515 [Candidatus Eisenbacteria bacterium]|nr:hypothetical protein [Candidatus Eisenbacteria bacterium]